MLVNDEAIREVARLAPTLDSSASSHWDGSEGEGRNYDLAKDPFDFTRVFSSFDVIGPIGTLSSKTSFPFKLAHWILQIPLRIMGIRLKGFCKIDRIAASIANRQSRAYDGDLMRHTLTMALLSERLDINRDTRLVAVIGDGFGNMSSLMLGYVPSSRVILVNLTKSLLLDLVFLRKAFPDENIALVQNSDEIKTAVACEDTRIIAVRADDADILAQAPVTLGINISSMMEMTPPVTAAYFDVLRRAPADQTAFYCSNRATKEWADGTVIRFSEYPWHDEDRLLVDGPCPWNRFGYRRRPPFYFRRKSLVKHRLVYLKKNR